MLADSILIDMVGGPVPRHPLLSIGSTQGLVLFVELEGGELGQIHLYDAMYWDQSFWPCARRVDETVAAWRVVAEAGLVRTDGMHNRLSLDEDRIPEIVTVIRDAGHHPAAVGITYEALE